MTDTVTPVRKVIEVTFNVRGSIQIEQFEPGDRETADIVDLPHEDVAYLIEQLFGMMLERRKIPDTSYTPDVR